MHTHFGTIFALAAEVRHFTTIVRFDDGPRAGLEVLWAPVALAPSAGEPNAPELARGEALTNVEPVLSTPEERAVGHVRGVVVDDDGCVRFLVVALEREARR